MNKFNKLNNLSVIAILKVKENKINDVIELLVEQIIKIREEEGYIKFDLQQSEEDENSIILNEIWRSENDLIEHFKQKHTQKLLLKLDYLLVEPMVVWKSRVLEF